MAATKPVSSPHDEYTPTDSNQEKHDRDEALAGEPEYIKGLRLFLIMLTIFMSTLLAALEIGIIATAIPGITDDFHRLDDVGWYGSATFLLVGASSPMWGKLYKYLQVKWVYLGSIVFYLVGSIVAAAAPNSTSVIVGRAIQGLGAAGTLGGSVLVISLVAEPKNRPVLIGSWMGVFMVSTILGPVIGGAFTSGVSWRWCFWINLPLGAPVLFLCLLFLRVPKHVKPAPATWTEIILQLDLPGFSLLLGSLVCFALALQWGGQTKAWSSGVVIATLVLWIAFTIIFFIVEAFQGSRAMVPLALLKPRMTWAQALWCYISNSSFYQVMFYLPIYFQSIHGKSAVMSGVDTLPFLAFFSLGALISGVVVGKTRHLMPFQLVSALLMVAGMALFYTMGVDSPQARYLGPQVLYGFALGLGNQIPMTAVQGFSSREDVASSTGIMLMCQSISGTYFVIVAQSLFANRMLLTLAGSNSSVDTAKALGTGASEIQHVFKGDELRAVTNAYMVGIKDVFAFGLAGAAAAVLLALLIPLRQLPDHDSKKKLETGAV
ncbi:dynein heavy chain [Penicillium rubens]|uniref:Pc21g12420 protein n=3 Tax=Penicillium chrysogenum species complex TaxID=254878 RepID=B6HLN1_PENRW|nr:dynein heavy chain [Penicillium rubens]KAJ5048975.1 dynein heavy chain [Penicillium rubens]CAP96139.1 Pc21g12420 [Penicillium rubens Wisconsin 54-1255]